MLDVTLLSVYIALATANNALPQVACARGNPQLREIEQGKGSGRWSNATAKLVVVARSAIPGYRRFLGGGGGWDGRMYEASNGHLRSKRDHDGPPVRPITLMLGGGR